MSRLRPDTDPIAMPPASALTELALPALALLGIAMLVGAATAHAEPFAEREAERYYELGAMPGGAPGACTIIYYDLCSGWMIKQPNMIVTQRIGVVYDLAAECGGGEEHECENIANYWYWNVAGGGYFGPQVMYSLWGVDSSYCYDFNESGSVTMVPMNGWNAIPGLGTAPANRVALVANKTFSNFTFNPYTDSNVKNAAGGPACAGAVIGAGSSVRFGTVPYDCPPAPYTDALGPVNLLVRSVWNCPTATGVAGRPGSTESTTWSDLKQLFQ